MDLDEVAAMLRRSGLPVTYNQWPPGRAPDPPFICYRFAGSNNLHADGGVYYSGSSVEMELFTNVKDPAVEATGEETLDGIHWEKSEDFIESQQCFRRLYEIEV